MRILKSDAFEFFFTLGFCVLAVFVAEAVAG